MWEVLLSAAMLVGTTRGACDTDTVFFGHLDPSSVSPYQLQVISALGTYVREQNNVSLVAYKHIGRPDQFLIQEPTASQQKDWVIATLPDDKKPKSVSHAYESWPEAGNIIVSGMFEADPWDAPNGSWQVPDCGGRRKAMKGLGLSCVAKTFGQCSTNRYNVSSNGKSALLTGSVTPSLKYSNGRQEYESLSMRVYADKDGRWRVTGRFDGLDKSGIVSSTPAERLEYVQAWKTYDVNNLETDDPDMKVTCESIPTITGGDPCANNPCKNGGTCFPDPSATSSYFCRCNFDSVSPNCAQIRECSAPPSIANGHLLFTSDLSPHGKAFYRCDVGYYIKNADSKADKKANAFAICDGATWKNVPSCVPITTNVNITSAYIHHCDFNTDWCGYSYAPSFTIFGRSLGWQRVSAGTSTTTSSSDGGRKTVAVAEQRSAEAGKAQVALLKTPCMFVPSEGCVAIDVKIESPRASAGASAGANITLTVIDDDDVVLWQTQTPTDWTTATLTLPPGGNQLRFEARVTHSGDKVSIDNIRVFQWNCKQVSKLLFPPAPKAGAGMASSETMLSLLTLVLLLAYSKMTGVVAE